MIVVHFLTTVGCFLKPAYYKYKAKRYGVVQYIMSAVLCVSINDNDVLFNLVCSNKK
jgi:hypothetical protein